MFFFVERTVIPAKAEIHAAFLHFFAIKETKHKSAGQRI